MANINQAYRTATSATITLASLGSGSGRCSTAIDNSTNKDMAVDVRVKIKTGASGVSATGYISVYLVRSEDGTTYDDGFGGTDASYTAVNAILLGVMTANANATTYNKVFDTQELGLTLPSKYAIAVVNNTGSALDTTAGNHEVKYTQKYGTAV